MKILVVLLAAVVLAGCIIVKQPAQIAPWQMQPSYQQERAERIRELEEQAQAQEINKEQLAIEQERNARER